MAAIAKVSDLVDELVTSGRTPGAVVVVRSGGDVVHRSAHGVLDQETGYELRTDTVFWLASLSKVFGATGLLILADEGLLDVMDPISKYIPEFASPGRVRTLRSGSPSPIGMPFGPPPEPPPEFDEFPAERELTLFDLLTHTGGLQSIRVWNPEFVMPAPGQTLADYVPGLGSLVRDFQPGKGWAYSNSAGFDVISRVIEIVSGQEVEAFLRARIFEPLNLRSVGFGRAGQPDVQAVPAMFSSMPTIEGSTFHSTSAGLWGTADDYLVIAETLRNGGIYGSTRLLKPATVERMTTNQIGDLCPGLNGRPPAPGIGFGLSVAVVVDPVAAGEALPAGTFGWDGVGTCRFWASTTGGWSMFSYADSEVQREIEAAVVASIT